LPGHFANGRALSHDPVRASGYGDDGRFIDSDAFTRQTDLGGRCPQINRKVRAESFSNPGQHPCFSVFWKRRRSHHPWCGGDIADDFYRQTGNYRKTQIFPAFSAGEQKGSGVFFGE